MQEVCSSSWKSHRQDVQLRAEEDGAGVGGQPELPSRELVDLRIKALGVDVDDGGCVERLRQHDEVDSAVVELRAGEVERSHGPSQLPSAVGGRAPLEDLGLIGSARCEVTSSGWRRKEAKGLTRTASKAMM